MIRVLFVTDEMEAGGTQRQIVTLCKSMDRSRFTPTVLYFTNPSFLVDELRSAGIQTLEIPKSGGVDLAFVRRIGEFIRDGRFDVVHAFAISGEWWAYVATRMLSPRPSLITSVRGRYGWYSRLHWWAKRLISAASFKVVANSRAAADYAVSMGGVKQERLAIVPNGIDQHRLASEHARANMSRAGSRFTLQFVGRLVMEKNIPCLLRAMSRIPSQRRPLLRMAGDGPLCAAMRDLVASLGLENDVEWLGQVADVAPLYATADVLVQTSSSESLSNTLIEAQASGLPVVATKVGGNPEVVEDGVSGFLVADDDDEAVAARIEDLMSDTSLRLRLGQNGRRIAEARFSVEAMVRDMCNIYELACATR